MKIEQETKTVLIKSVDDKKLLKGLKAGDHVVITYTKAMAISVE